MQALIILFENYYFPSEDIIKWKIWSYLAL